MNIQVRIEDANWKTMVTRALSALKSSDSLLKKAFLMVWPRDAASHFDQEQGPEGQWAAWKESTRASRIAHEISVTSLKQRTKARKAGIREGGKLLQISGRLRTETTLEPIFTNLPNGLKVESPTPYSGYLDEGTGKMVARPFMWLGEEAQDTLGKVFADLLGDKIGGTD